MILYFHVKSFHIYTCRDVRQITFMLTGGTGSNEK